MAKRRPFCTVVQDYFELDMWSDLVCEFTPREAFLWLVFHAAWKPRAARPARGQAAVHLERGQLSFTLEVLAKTWGWPVIRVRRYLAWLAERETITRTTRRGSRLSSSLSIRKSYRVTVVTICNYDKFNSLSSLAKMARPAASRAPLGAAENPELPMALAQVRLPPLSTSSPVDSSKRSAEQGQRTKPRHGSKGRGMVWFDHATEEWRLYAADWKEATGTDKLPERRIGGSGNWFKWLGEKKRA